MSVTVIGLGPAGLDRLPASTVSHLLDPTYRVVVRTLQHPAAEELGARRTVISCDDLYQGSDSFEDVYQRVVERVVALAGEGPTIYAVPGSPQVGEFAVALLAETSEIEVIPGESFLDATLAAARYDPLDRGLRIINGHQLPVPLLVDGPTLVAHLDQPLILADAVATISRVVGEDTRAMVVVNAGGPDQLVVNTSLDEVDFRLAGLRTSMFLDPTPGGLPGVVQTMARLRRECPWDRKQTHESLTKNLIEETYELVDAIASGSEGELEDELGDVLLQVLFHSAISSQEGGFGIEDVAENLRQKLVRRHPHVFATVVADDAEQVKANWEQIKEAERGEKPDSALDGVPVGMPGLERAAKLQRKAAAVGFDWPNAEPVLAKVREEVDEVSEALATGERVEPEIGDLLFSVVNLARHLSIDPELALAGTISRFIERFQLMETTGDLEGMTLEELDARWDEAKTKLK